MVLFRINTAFVADPISLDMLVHTVNLHIRFSEAMALKTVFFCLPLMMCNEASHDDCVLIMDNLIAELSQLYTLAFGKYLTPLFLTSMFRAKYKCFCRQIVIFS